MWEHEVYLCSVTLGTLLEVMEKSTWSVRVLMGRPVIWCVAINCKNAKQLTGAVLEPVSFQMISL